MSQTIVFLIATIAIAALFLLLNWIFWGTKRVRTNVFPKVPKEMWRGGMFDAEGKPMKGNTMWLGSIVTLWTAIVFVPMVWMFGPQFANARIILLALLLWAAFELPGALYCGVFYRFPASYLKLQVFVGLARIVLGLVLVTWLFSIFRVW